VILLAVTGVLLFGLAIGLIARAALLPRAHAALRLQEIDAYGFTAPNAAPAAGPDVVQVGPLTALARRLGDLVARYVGNVREQDIRRRLVAAGMYSASPRAVMGYRVLSLLVFGFLGAFNNLLPGAAGHILVTAAMAYLGWRAPEIFIERRAKQRCGAIDRGLPDVIDQIVITLEAGVGFSPSMQIAGDRMKGPLGDELRLTLQEQRMGRSLRAALQNMLERVDTPNMRSFVRAVTQGEALGVSIGTVMRNLAVEMRRTRRQQAEERAQRAPVKILFPLIFMIFPALGVVLLGPAFIQIKDTLGG
jgi:tight adherence protein C